MKRNDTSRYVAKKLGASLRKGQIIAENMVPIRIRSQASLKVTWLPIFERIPQGKALVLEDISAGQSTVVRSSLNNLQHRYGLLKGYRFVVRKDLDGRINGYVIHGTIGQTGTAR